MNGFVSFLHEELSWSISKVDDELTPIVQRISLRGKHGALNKQGTLDPFFDLSAGAGQYYAPRRREVGSTNVSKRLMGVIKQFKEAESRISRGEDVDAILAEEENKAKGKRKADDGDGDGEGEGEDEKEGGGKKKKKKTSARGRRASSVGDSVESSEGTSRSTSTSGRGRGGSRGRGRARGKSK